MNSEEFKKTFNLEFSKFLKERIEKTKSYFEEYKILSALDKIYKMYAFEGKRIRPYALYLMYISAGGQDKHDPMVAGIANEMEHVFALVHDDIIDRSDVRHGSETTQKYIKDSLVKEGLKKEAEHLGNAYAVLVGDLILGWSFNAINSLNNEHRDRASFYFQEMVNEVISGEIIDISLIGKEKVSTNVLDKRDAMKTSSDTFVYPMLIGATIAGKEDKYETFCKKFGSIMGKVYQIHDDLLDIVGEEGLADYSDIDERQHTFLTQYIFKKGADGDRMALEKFFARDEGVQRETIIKILSSPEVVGFAKQESNRLLAEAREMLNREVDISEKNKQLWHGLIGFFEQRFD